MGKNEADSDRTARCRKAAAAGQQIKVARITSPLKKHPLLPVATLGHMVRLTGKHEARKTAMA